MALEYDFQENRFSTVDYVVFAVVLAIASVIGLYYGCTGNRQSSTSEFLMAGRSMSVLPVALSLLASFMSAILLLGTPAEVAIYGTQYWIVCVSFFFVIPIAAYVFIPVFYRLQVTSIFEVKKRWSNFLSYSIVFALIIIISERNYGYKVFIPFSIARTLQASKQATTFNLPFIY